VYLLDKGQPTSIGDDDDKGKAIAIHGGPHPDTSVVRNIAFKMICK